MTERELRDIQKSIHSALALVDSKIAYVRDSGKILREEIFNKKEKSLLDNVYSVTNKLLQNIDHDNKKVDLFYEIRGLLFDLQDRLNVLENFISVDLSVVQSVMECYNKALIDATDQHKCYGADGKPVLDKNLEYVSKHQNMLHNII